MRLSIVYMKQTEIIMMTMMMTKCSIFRVKGDAMPINIVGVVKFYSQPNC